jgi:hypothetical protein
MNRDEARKRSWSLAKDLRRISDRDAEQEVTGIAVPVLDALLQAAKVFVPDDPVVMAIDGLVTPEAVESGSLRALDAYLVVHQLAQALGPEHEITQVHVLGGDD